MRVKILKTVVYFLYRFLSFCKFLFSIFFWSFKNNTSPIFWEVQKGTRKVKRIYKERNPHLFWNSFMTLFSFIGNLTGSLVDFVLNCMWLGLKKKNLLFTFKKDVESSKFSYQDELKKRKDKCLLAFFRYILKNIVFFYGWLELSIPMYLFIPVEKWVVSKLILLPFLLNRNQSQIKFSDWEIETYISRPIQFFFRNLTQNWISFFRARREKMALRFHNIFLNEYDLFWVKETVVDEYESFYFVNRKDRWSNYFLKKRKEKIVLKSVLVEVPYRKFVFCWKWLEIDRNLKMKFISWLGLIDKMETRSSKKKLKWMDDFLSVSVFLFKVFDLPFLLINKLVYGFFLIIVRWFLTLVELFKFKK